MSYTWLDLGFYFLLYSFLGWAIEVSCYAVARRSFANRGFLNLPFLPSYGIVMDLLLIMLPGLAKNAILQFIATLVVVSVVENLSSYFIQRSTKKLHLEPSRDHLFSGNYRGLLASVSVAAACYLIYLIIHPLFIGLELLMPDILVKILVIALLILMGLDFATVYAAVRAGDASSYAARRENSQNRKWAEQLSDAIWSRLLRAYPGITEKEDEDASGYTFAKGLCLDKLIWVFLTSALLGDIIETFYCGVFGGQWMNRSSVLYGPFSFVWGLGAVVLTVSLQRFARKNDRYVFAAGFVIGGTYEYLCSVFTEIVFGTVFWDYSHMPLNIGGRTNVLYCFFWGLLAVVWIKMLYPPMSNAIEKLPPLMGKVLTWVLVFLMVCNALLTGAAMLRYRTRAVRSEPNNVFEQFLDQQYDDAYMEARWPNMVVTDAQN